MESDLLSALRRNSLGGMEIFILVLQVRGNAYESGFLLGI